MTDDEAREVLKSADGEGYIRWDDARDCPDWSDGMILIDGWVSADELRALLHFAPAASVK